MIRTLNCAGKNYTFVGTAHVSEQSVLDVRKTVEEEQPDHVCVELDSERFKNLMERKRWSQTDVVEIFKSKKAMLLLASLVLSSFQRRLGGTVEPGKDMQEAIEAAKRQNAQWVLCDRSINTTLSRAWRTSRLWSKCKLLASVITSIFSSQKIDQEAVEALKQGNEIDAMMRELSEYLPNIKSVLIDERDRYLAQKIFDVKGEHIVVVLGAGHLEGVIKSMKDIEAGTLSVDLDELSRVPRPGILSRILPWIVPLVILGVIGSGFLANEWAGVLENMWKWVLVNGTLSALGALVALAHPVTIVASFLLAPLTSLNPTIGVGFVTGFFQLWLRKPRTIDFERMNSDIKTIRGFFRNRVTHALLVFFFTSLGSAIGTFVALPFLFP